MTSIDDLLTAAKVAAEAAYVPYCDFPVGAAILMTDGRTFLGVNVDNASSPLTVCAERSAVSNAVTAGARTIRAVAIHGAADSVSPCGGCRQVLLEFAQAECTVTFPWFGEPMTTLLADLLPYAFTLRSAP